VNAQRGVCVYICVCVCIYIDMVFWEDTVQAANMFSVTNAKYLKRNCEFNVLFFESGLDSLRKLDTIISENSKIPILLLFLGLMQLLEI
jgi:hypothetical protein